MSYLIRDKMKGWENVMPQFDGKNNEQFYYIGSVFYKT